MKKTLILSLLSLALGQPLTCNSSDLITPCPSTDEFMWITSPLKVEKTYDIFSRFHSNRFSASTVINQNYKGVTYSWDVAIGHFDADDHDRAQAIVNTLINNGITTDNHYPQLKRVDDSRSSLTCIYHSVIYPEIFIGAVRSYNDELPTPPMMPPR